MGIVMKPIPNIVCDALAIGIVFRMTKENRNLLEVLLKIASVARRSFSLRQIVPEHTAEFVGQVAHKTTFPDPVHTLPAVPTQSLLLERHVESALFHGDGEYPCVEPYCF